jgi:Undecaprenyl-phosphate galactose phosphotransferase WbaP
MADAGAILRRGVAPEGGYRGWQRSSAGFIGRFRKFVVAGSLMAGDIVAAIAAVSLSRALLEWTGMQLPGTPFLSIALLILALFAVGLYSGTGPSPYERFRLRTLAVMGFIAIDLLPALLGSRPGYLFVSEICKGFFLLLFGHYVEAMVRALLIRLHLWGAPTVMVGCDGNSQDLALLLVSQPDLGLTPIGFIATPEDRDLHNSGLPLPLLGTISHPDRGRGIEVAIFNSAHGLAAAASAAQPWMQSSCQLLFVENAHDIQSLWLHTRMLGGAIGIEIRRDLCRRYNQLFKRLIDILFAIPLALLACPLIAALAVAIKIVDPGPAFHVQDRVGRNGTTLRMLKLRTMYTDAESRLEEHLGRDAQARAEWQRFFKLSHDPRVLPIIGNFLRRTSIDELPQLWNVLRGDMSLVGPRPFPCYHMRSFDPEFQAIRVSVQPGITGMWQVSSRSDGDLQIQKAQDLFYIRNWSIWLDVYILMQTVLVVLSGKGAR